jgi:AraC-like DNA-binding protein
MTAVALNRFEPRRVDRSAGFDATVFDLDDSSSRTVDPVAANGAIVSLIRSVGAEASDLHIANMVANDYRNVPRTISSGARSIERRIEDEGAIRVRLPGGEAVLSISMESNETDLARRSPTMIDLTEKTLGGEHLAAIVRWLTERLQVRSDALQPLAPTGLTKWRLKRVLTYIDEHVCESVSLAALAQVAGLSRMYFAAQFRAATGCRPHEWILRKRIERAQHLLLETSEPLVSIALAVGFQSQAHFSTVFKRFAGRSPHQWRDANRDVRSLGGRDPRRANPSTAAAWRDDALPSGAQSFQRLWT